MSIAYLPWDAPPRSGRQYKPNTIDDFWKVELEPSNYILRPVNEDLPYRPSVFERADWQEKLKKSFIEYQRLRVIPGRPWYVIPDFNNWFDKFRFFLHIKLLKWGVII